MENSALVSAESRLDSQNLCQSSLKFETVDEVNWNVYLRLTLFLGDYYGKSKRDIETRVWISDVYAYFRARCAAYPGSSAPGRKLYAIISERILPHAAIKRDVA